MFGVKVESFLEVEGNLVSFPSREPTQEGTVGTHTVNSCVKHLKKDLFLFSAPQRATVCDGGLGPPSLQPVTPRSASRCLCCAPSCPSNGARSPERCRRAPAPSPGTAGCRPLRPGPGWTRDLGPSWCQRPELWRRRRSGTPASPGDPQPGTALAGCWGSDDTEAAGGGASLGCRRWRAEAPNWTLTQSLQNQHVAEISEAEILYYLKLNSVSNRVPASR